MMVICTTGFSARAQAELEGRIRAVLDDRQQPFLISPKLTHSCSVLIVAAAGSPKHQAATNIKKPCVDPTWVTEGNCDLACAASFPVKGLRGMTICATSLSPACLTTLERVVAANGGTLVGRLTRSVGMLVVPMQGANPANEKVKFALANSVRVLSLDRLYRQLDPATLGSLSVPTTTDTTSSVAAARRTEAGGAVDTTVRLSRCVVCLTPAYLADAAVIRRVKALGMQRVPVVTPATTHLVVLGPSFDVLPTGAESAATSSLRVVTTQWLDACYERQSVVPSGDFRSTLPFRPVFAFSGISDERLRHTLTDYVEKLGGTVQPDFVLGSCASGLQRLGKHGAVFTTHLVVPKEAAAASAKVQLVAKRWQDKRRDECRVVTPEFVLHSAANASWVDSTPFRVDIEKIAAVLAQAETLKAAVVPLSPPQRARATASTPDAVVPRASEVPPQQQQQQQQQVAAAPIAVAIPATGDRPSSGSPQEALSLTAGGATARNTMDIEALLGGLDDAGAVARALEPPLANLSPPSASAAQRLAVAAGAGRVSSAATIAPASLLRFDDATTSGVNSPLMPPPLPPSAQATGVSATTTGSPFQGAGDIRHGTVPLFTDSVSSRAAAASSAAGTDSHSPEGAPRRTSGGSTTSNAMGLHARLPTERQLSKPARHSAGLSGASSSQFVVFGGNDNFASQLQHAAFHPPPPVPVAVAAIPKPHVEDTSAMAPPIPVAGTGGALRATAAVVPPRAQVQVQKVPPPAPARPRNEAPPGAGVAPPMRFARRLHVARSARDVLAVEPEVLVARLEDTCVVDTIAEATHFITARPNKTEAFLAAVAGGLWVLRPAVLEQLKPAAGLGGGGDAPAWPNEKDYEWHPDFLSEKDRRSDSLRRLVLAARREFQLRRQMPTHKWHVALCSSDHSRAASFLTVLRMAKVASATTLICPARCSVAAQSGGVSAAAAASADVFSIALPAGANLYLLDDSVDVARAVPMLSAAWTALGRPGEPRMLKVSYLVHVLCDEGTLPEDSPEVAASFHPLGPSGRSAAGSRLAVPGKQ